MRPILHALSKTYAIAFLFLIALRTVQADVNPIPVTTVSAASYENAAVTPGSVVSAFGTKLATATTNATDLDPSTPAIDLPTNLSGTTVQVNGQFAGLLFVSPLQVNFVIPAGTVQGSATIKIISGDGTESNGTVEIAQVRPSIFTFNSNGQGVLAAEVVRVKANGAQVRESLVQRDETTNQYVTKPIDLGPEGERVFLEIYLTGIRGANDANGDGNLNENVWVLVGGQILTPAYAGRQPYFAGLDQINVELPRSLIGIGKLNLSIHARVGASNSPSNPMSFTSNLVQLEISSPANLGAAPIITNVSVSTAEVGQIITLNGSGFAPNAADNTVTIGGAIARVEAASNSQLSIRVPFGAITGKVKVKTSQGEGNSVNTLTIRTSVSGFVETSRTMTTSRTDLPAPLRDFTVRVVGTSISTATNQDGVFTLQDVPEGAVTIEVDPATSAAAWAFPQKYQRQINVIAGRNNLLSSFWLPGPNGSLSEFASSTRAGYAITGNVVDKASGAPLANVSIRAIDVNALGINYYSTYTDAAGSFVIRNMPSAMSVSYRLIFSYINPDGTISRVATGGGTSAAFPNVVNTPTGISGFLFDTTPTNREPLVFVPTSITMNVNEVKDVAIFADDPDPNENLQIAVSGPQGISIIPGAGGAYTIRLAPKSGGASTVKVTVTDSNGGVTSRDISLTVVATNAAPTVTVPGAKTIGVGQTLTFNVSATDPDEGQTLTLVAMNMPQGASFTPASPVGALTGTFSWTPTQVGTYTVNFTATDNGNPPKSDSKSVTITVSSSPTTGQNDWSLFATSLPADASIKTMLVKGSTILLGGKAIYRSTDGGMTWTTINNNWPTAGIVSLALAGNSILAGTGETFTNENSGIHISTDDGLTWQGIYKPLSSGSPNNIGEASAL